MVINTAFYPSLMWNARFASLSGDPFDNSAGFLFPAPEGTSLSYLPHLLDAQAFIPPTERVEAAGFAFPGDNDAIRAEVVRRLNATPRTTASCSRASFPEVRAGRADHARAWSPRAIAEFEFTLMFANAPIDRYARGERERAHRRRRSGARCSSSARPAACSCHQVSGRVERDVQRLPRARDRRAADRPRRRPTSPFDGPGANEDFGLEQVTGDPADRYAFRTSPLRNVALQPAFMHNGAFTSLEDAIRHHLDVVASALTYDPARTRARPRPARADRADRRRCSRGSTRSSPHRRSSREEQLDALVAFVRDGLLDPRPAPERLRRLVPDQLPSGRAPLRFEFPPNTGELGRR